MWSQIFLGCLLVLVTTVVHGVATAVALIVLQKTGRLMHLNKTSQWQRSLVSNDLDRAPERECRQCARGINPAPCRV